MHPQPSIRQATFWYGFVPLLLTFALAQASLQVDIIMLAQRHPGMSGAYALFTRLVLIDLVWIMAVGSVASVLISQAQRQAQSAQCIRWVLAWAAGIGVILMLAGALIYPLLARWLTSGQAYWHTLLAQALPWFIAGAPFRLINACAAFALHATGQGQLAIRWKLSEVAAKIGLNWLFLDTFEFGFSACFVSSLIVQLVSSLWVLTVLRRQTGGWPAWPPKPWRREQSRKAHWEAQRVLAMQLLGLATIGLFTWPALSPISLNRLDALGAGLALAALLFAPLAAFTRLLTLRFSSCQPAQINGLINELRCLGLPIFILIAGLLALSRTELGQHIYQQHGPWWSWFVISLALSLPVRLLSALYRAALQSQSHFQPVTKADTVLNWGLGIPLLLIGLRLDCPLLAFAYLWLPEICIAAWLHRLYLINTQSTERAAHVTETSQ